MKVIKHGNAYIEKEHTCGSCGCVFTYIKDDIVTDTSCDEYCGEYYNYFHTYVICPECQSWQSLIFLINGVDQLK